MINLYSKEFFESYENYFFKYEAVDYEFQFQESKLKSVFKNDFIKKVWNEFESSFPVVGIESSLVGFSNKNDSKKYSKNFKDYQKFTQFIDSDIKLNFIQNHIDLEMYWYNEKTDEIGKSIFRNCASFYLWDKDKSDPTDEIWLNFEVIPNFFTNTIRYQNDKNDTVRINFKPAAELNRKWLKEGLEKFKKNTFSKILNFSSYDLILFNSDKIPYYLCKDNEEYSERKEK